MSCAESQEEEIEVLESIYDGDECFKALNATTFQYKVGEDQNYKSFLVEVKWDETYPEELPVINLDLFYNKHLLPAVKENICSKLKEEAEALLGCAMTYTLFEFAKENADSLTEEQPEAPPQVVSEVEEKKENPNGGGEAKIKVRKEQLTKAQKRKITNRVDLNTGEMARGHDWVDVIKHLSKTGGFET